MEASKTLEQAEHKSRRALRTQKVLTVVACLIYFVLLVLVIRKGMQHRSKNIIDDIQIEQLAVVTLHLIDPKPRDQAVLEEQFRAALPRAFRLMELTRNFLDAKSEAESAKVYIPKQSRKE